MIRRGTTLRIFVIALLIVSPTRADNVLVLVTGVDSSIAELSNLEVRKIYLGVSVRVGDEPIEGIRNVSNDRLDEIFLQNIVAMSERAYERRLLSFMLRYGRPRPTEISDTKELLERLFADPYAISYMWKADAENLKEIRILREVWRR